jgi:hypothetical protein
MSRTLFPSRAPFRAAVIPAIAVGLLLFAAQSKANIAHDAMVFFNVRPHGSPEELCQTDISGCSEMHSSTSAQGLLEFQIFIDPAQWAHGALPVPYFVGYFSWPDTWTVVDYGFCGEEGGGYFESSGPSPHYLVMGWGCSTVPNGMFLGMTIVFDVQGYGKFEPVGDCTLALGCGDELLVTPEIQFAEAGACEYYNHPCFQGGLHCCTPQFSGAELEMTGIEGGTAHAEMDFTVFEGEYCTSCWWDQVHSETPWIIGNVEWIAAHVEGGYTVYDFTLFADADLTGLAPGEYQSELQVEADGQIARCLPVTVTVASAAAVDGTASGQSGATPLDLRLMSANPFSGPFVLAYDNPAAAWVRCGVYDVAGREIDRLLDGQRSGGPLTITWGATDARGDRVQPGVYLIRLEAGGAVRGRRVVVVR